MARIFGTDGVRGVANTELTPELGLRLGRAATTVLREEGVTRPVVAVGRDPRWSGEMLEAALAAGVLSAGGDVVRLGMLPTAGVAHLAATGDADLGAMISASHNPVADNGIKFFGGDGFKLTDAEEDRLEELLHADGAGSRPVGDQVGRVYEDPDAVRRYVEHLVAAADTDLSGLRVVLDAANGAASQISPQVLRHLGADVVVINAAPDGRNINVACGSTYPGAMMDAVREHGADVGIAHDGDADRLIAADHLCGEVDGDVILAILARDLHARGRLAHDTVVTTVMTNLGFRQAMQGLGIDVVTTKVGDRYVLEAMRERGLVLGGEQSGHLISLDHATTGDGILSAVRLLTTMERSGRSLTELAKVMTPLPQVLVNVPEVDKAGLDGADRVWSAIADAESDLDGDGRVLVRPSGTEPVIRVMVEAGTAETARQTADRIAEVIAAELGR